MKQRVVNQRNFVIIEEDARAHYLYNFVVSKRTSTMIIRKIYNIIVLLNDRYACILRLENNISQSYPYS